MVVFDSVIFLYQKLREGRQVKVYVLVKDTRNVNDRSDATHPRSKSTHCACACVSTSMIIFIFVGSSEVME